MQTERLAAILLMHREQFNDEFLFWIEPNLHIYNAFAERALFAISKGRERYSARTIVESLRHHSQLSQRGGPWKINDHCLPYLGRLFALEYPEHATLFERRRCPTAEVSRG